MQGLEYFADGGIYLVGNGLTGAYLAIFAAMHHRPTKAVCGVKCGLAAMLQICGVALVNIFFALVTVVAAAHKALRNVDGHIEKDNCIGLGNSKLLKLKLIKPVEIIIALVGIKL